MGCIERMSQIGVRLLAFFGDKLAALCVRASLPAPDHSVLALAQVLSELPPGDSVSRRPRRSLHRVILRSTSEGSLEIRR